MEKLKILVVDDESRMRKLIKDFLERETVRRDLSDPQSKQHVHQTV